MTNDASRPLAILLFGATGFTGRLVAEYLARRVGTRVPWALAGRHERKLEAVKKDLVAIDPALSDLPIHVVDARDRKALDALVPQARVVCTTVGPYALLGRALVAACAGAGTSYCDLTGEVHFIRASIDENQAIAEKTRARIVHCCGYDSIPSDLCVYLAWEHARRHGHDLAWAKVFAGKTKGSASGGTIASMMGVVEAAKSDRRARKLFANPHALDPAPPTYRDPFEADQKGVRYDDDLGRWTAPFVMAMVNSRVVRRSNALLGYGAGFRYHEAMSVPKGARGFVMGSMVVAGLAGFTGALTFGPTRALLQRTVLPAPGEGPSREAIAAGYFQMLVVARTTGGELLRGRIEGRGDPGYGATARMLGESALCLAEDDLDARFGVLTPASAMGAHLVTRLRAADMTLQVRGDGEASDESTDS